MFVHRWVVPAALSLLGLAGTSLVRAGPVERLAVARLAAGERGAFVLVTDPASGALLVGRGGAIALPGGQIEPAAAARDWIAAHAGGFGIERGGGGDRGVGEGELATRV